ncbi:MAG: DUF6602 domain-containing protein [Bacteroidota bacterium]
MKWSLTEVLASLHDDVQHRLQTARKSIGHPTSRGDASESVWIELLNTYLPERYRAAKATVADSKGEFSDQIDVVVYDRQYSPLIFTYEGETVIAAESVYAVFEAKQSTSAKYVGYAQDKAESVRRLHRTSLPIPYAGGVYPPKPPPHLTAGLLTFESDWKSPPMGDPLRKALGAGEGDRQLDLGCIAAHGYFERDSDSGVYHFDTDGKHATGFLFRLIADLQMKATVPMIDIAAYAEWLAD